MPDVTTDQMRCAGYVSGDNRDLLDHHRLAAKAVAGIRMGFLMRVINLLKWTALCGAFGVVGCASRTVIVRERVVRHEPVVEKTETVEETPAGRSEERRVGKECRSRWS